jgi:membrane complex biogenesis BtpA family protein
LDKIQACFGRAHPIIGMIHLPPLPGYVDSPGIEQVIRQAVADLHTLQAGGVDGVLVENEYDRPHRIKANAETTAAMTRITREIVHESRNMAVGCEILLHDPEASLAVAATTGADFIRVDYFVDRMTRPEYGEFDIDPDGLLRYRSSIGADDVLILADIQVKYAEMVEPRPIRASAELAREKGADAVIVTGDASGNPPSIEDLQQAATGLPVLIGSGLDATNAKALLAECDGAIVGTSIMSNGRVDAIALAQLMSAIRGN